MTATVFEWAIRELTRSRMKLLGVFFILVVGFLGPLFSSALKTSVDGYLQFRSRQILSADLAVSNQREFKTEELKSAIDISKAERTSMVTEFVTMAAGKDASTLIEVQAVDENFPIYGVFEFEDGTKTASAKALSEAKIAWGFPEILAQLGLKSGDEISIGKLKVKLTGILKDGPGLSRAGGFAPRIYMSRKLVAETGLTQFGSQVSYRLYLQLPKGASAEVEGSAIKEVLADPDIFIRTPDDSTNRLERFFTFFNLYLVSISMIVFALSWISAFYILQIYLQDRIKNAAVLLTFGASKSLAIVVAGLQIFFVMLVSLGVAAVLVSVAVLTAPSVAADIFPVGFVLRLGWTDIGKLAAIAVVSSAAFLSPLIIRLSFTPLQDLLHESTTGVGRLNATRASLSYGPLGLVFILLSVWLMNSWQNALSLTGGLLASVFIGWGLSRLVFKSLFRVLKNTPGAARLVVTNLSRSRFGVNLCFISILIGTLVLNLVPHLMKSAVAEIAPLQGGEVPALFLFNIPESTVESLKAFAEKQNVQLRFLSPMVLARLVKINNKPTDNDQFQRFPVRLSYRNGLIGSEKLIQGQLPTSDIQPGAIPLISVEKEFASRNQMKIGDALEFEVQGVPVRGKIASLRSVKWTDFNPNFFMIFQGGVLDDAPKTFLANVNLAAVGAAREAQKSKVQYSLVKDYPDMSVLDIGRTLDRVLEVARSILGPVRASALIAVIMSFLVLMGVIVHNLRRRESEIDVQKILGADAALIRRLIVSEYLMLAGGASVLGAGFALLITAAVTIRILEIPMKIDGLALVISVTATIVLTGVIAYVSSTRVLNLRGATRKL